MWCWNCSGLGCSSCLVRSCLEYWCHLFLYVLTKTMLISILLTADGSLHTETLHVLNTNPTAPLGNPNPYIHLFHLALFIGLFLSSVCSSVEGHFPVAFICFCMALKLLRRKNFSAFPICWLSMAAKVIQFLIRIVSSLDRARNQELLCSVISHLAVRLWICG